MSGDVQPRKRKDKKKKRDSLDSKGEGETFIRKISSKDDEDLLKESHHHGVHSTKMGSDDVHLHVHSDHGTGGHWFAKIFFFGLLAILLGLVGLIIFENRGLQDLDTPLSESRYSEYFEGWVDEHRDGHDDHDEVDKIVSDLESHDEPFEENDDTEENHNDDEHGDEDDEQHSDDHEDEEETNSEEEQTDEKNSEIETEEEDDENEAESEDVAEKENDEDNEDEDSTNASKEQEENQEASEQDNDDSADVKHRVRREISPNESSKNDDDEDNADTEEEESDVTKDEDDEADEDTKEEDNNETVEEEGASENNDDDFDEKNSKTNITTNNENPTSDRKEEVLPPYSKEEIFDRTKRKIEDDGGFESLEKVVDNDADEILHLQEKAEKQEKARLQQERENKAEEPAEDEQEETQSSSLAVKIIVGVSLAIVARLVLIKKNADLNENADLGAIAMRRRLTIATPEEPIPLDQEDLLLLDEEEEIIEEIEIEEIEEEEEENNEILRKMKSYVPETFEDFNNMYRGVPAVEEIKTKEHVEDLKMDQAESPAEKIEIKKEEKSPLPSPSVKQISEEIKPTKIEKLSEPKVEISKGEELISPSTSGKINVRESGQQEIEETFIPKSASEKSTIETFIEKESSMNIEDIHKEDVEDLEEVDEEEEISYEDEELEEEYEEEVSDVDDDELMKRLEAKYGKLPEKKYDSEEEEEEEEDVDDRSWTKINPNARAGGAQDFDEDSYIEEELKRANEEMLRNNLQAALNIFESITTRYPNIPGAHYGRAKILDRLSEEHRSNQILTKAIDSYKRFLSFEELLDDKIFKEAAERCINRMRFRGLNLQAVNIHNMLIKRFPNEPQLRNELAVTYLLINRLPEAKVVLNETLSRWKNNGFALVHYGFILKNLDKDLEKAVFYLKAGIKTNAEGTNDGRFFFNLGDSLQRLGRNDEAMKVYREGAARGLFLSEYQRSLYNVDTLKSRPFWTKKETTYAKYLQVFEDNWKAIRDEGLSVLNEKGYFVDEAENLKDSGDWKQFELFAKGYRNKKNCLKAPFTCKLIEMFPAARFCKRGQTKFSIIHPNTHVWPHCGPTNCRLRAHLGLEVPPGVRIRVATKEKSWKEGKFLIFDDSFEHEVWHNGTKARLVLIIDVWHPDLSEEQKRSLSPI